MITSTVSIARCMRVTWKDLYELEQQLGIDIRKEAKRRYDKAVAKFGKIRRDGTEYTLEDQVWGLYHEFFICEAMDEHMDFTVLEHGDQCDFTKPLDWDGRSFTRFEGKGSRRGDELIINGYAIGKADAFILATSGHVGLRLLGWMTAPDVRTYKQATREGKELKYPCPVEDLRDMAELWQFIDSGTPLTNIIQQRSTW